MAKDKIKRERADSKSNTVKVAKEVLKNPLKTQREIAEEAWVSVGTVNAKLNSLEQEGRKDPLISDICKTDIENVSLWQAELRRRLKEKADKLKVNEIVQIIAEWTKRYTIFKWDITDKDWWLKDIWDYKKLTPRELEDIRQQLLDD